MYGAVSVQDDHLNMHFFRLKRPFTAQGVAYSLKSLVWSKLFILHVCGDAAWRAEFSNSALEGGKAMSTLASERAFDILGNHCPKAAGRQIKCHAWNSRLPGDEFFCWGGRKEQSHCEAFLARSGMRWKSARGGPLQKSDKWLPLQGIGNRQAWVARPSLRKPPLGWENVGLSIFSYMLSSIRGPDTGKT